jgi:FXSXX-COOH protein
MTQSNIDFADEAESPSLLPELGQVRISQLQQSTHPVIARAVRRVQREAEQGRENYAAFGNTP